MIDDQGSFTELFTVIYKEDEGAINLSLKLLEIVHTWDDLIDKDKPVTDDQINTAFMGCIFEVQQNPLWFQCGLNFHFVNVFLRWRDSHSIETDENRNENDLHKAYMLRAGIYDIFVIIAYHMYGDSWAKKIGPVVRRYYGETLNEYLEEFKNA